MYRLFIALLTTAFEPRFVSAIRPFTTRFSEATTKTFTQNCSWKPIHQKPTDKRQSLYEDFLAAMYIRAIQTGHPFVIDDGGMLCLFREGRLCGGDNDIDVRFKTITGIKLVYEETRKLPQFAKMGHVDFSVGASHLPGICTCYLPDGRPISCVAEPHRYARQKYGPAWWLPLPGAKTSIIYGQEKRGVWVCPFQKSITRLLSQSSTTRGRIIPSDLSRHAAKYNVSWREVIEACNSLNYVMSIPVKCH